MQGCGAPDERLVDLRSPERVLPVTHRLLAVAIAAAASEALQNELSDDDSRTRQGSVATPLPPATLASSQDPLDPLTLLPQTSTVQLEGSPGVPMELQAGAHWAPQSLPAALEAPAAAYPLSPPKRNPRTPLPMLPLPQRTCMQPQPGAARIGQRARAWRRQSYHRAPQSRPPAARCRCTPC